jgi:hypothetical protein
MSNQIQPATPEKLPRAAPPPALSKMLERIKGSPKAGWTIADIKTACDQLDMICSAPTRGTHYKVSSPHIEGILVIPAKRPIKLPYVRSFIGLAEAHVRVLRSHRKVEEPNG